MKTVA